MRPTGNAGCVCVCLYRALLVESRLPRVLLEKNINNVATPQGLLCYAGGSVGVQVQVQVAQGCQSTEHLGVAFRCAMYTRVVAAAAMTSLALLSRRVGAFSGGPRPVSSLWIQQSSSPSAARGPAAVAASAAARSSTARSRPLVSSTSPPPARKYRHLHSATAASQHAGVEEREVFDFETPVDRSGTGALKWDKYSGKDVIPMWVRCTAV